MVTNTQRRALVNNPAKSKQWLVNKIKSMSGVTKTSIIQATGRQKPTFTIGKMYFFLYDPKTKDDLPYYDRFPLVFPIETYLDGFLGINLHYLSPSLRVSLIDKLMDIANNTNFDDTTKLRISYKVLNDTRKYKAFRPCLKRYLLHQVNTRFIQIEASEWSEAILLPFHSFHGAPASKVWSDSRKKIS